MVAFACVVVYETPDNRRWVTFEDYDDLRRRARISDEEEMFLEWAITVLSATVERLEGHWDSPESRKTCANATKAVEVMRDMLERLS